MRKCRMLRPRRDLSANFKTWLTTALFRSEYSSLWAITLPVLPDENFWFSFRAKYTPIFADGILLSCVYDLQSGTKFVVHGGLLSD